jgi:hypothetical protein
MKKSKHTEMGFHSIKKLQCSTGNNKVKRQFIDGKKIFVNDTPDKGLIYKIHKKHK